MHGWAYDDFHVGIEKAIKSDPKTFFSYVDMKLRGVSNLV
jgi:hypothetical protein